MQDEFFKSHVLRIRICPQDAARPATVKHGRHVCIENNLNNKKKKKRSLCECLHSIHVLVVYLKQLKEENKYSKGIHSYLFIWVELN